MTRLVQGLAADGLVSCEVDAADRRRVIVRATPRGTRILRAGRERRVRALASRLAMLAPADLESLDRAAGVLGSLDWRGER
jgi:DNA-binding MarR family transcriptional regulator